MNKTLQNIKPCLLFPLLIPVIFILSGCLSHWKGDEARIILLLNGDNTASGRSVVYPPNNAILNQLEHTITLKNGTQEIILNSEGGENIDAVVPAGRWNISVDTYYEDIIYAKGSQTADLQPGEDNFVLVTLYKAFYNITIVTSGETGHGSLSVGQNRAGDGEQLTLTITLDRGYRIKSGSLYTNRSDVYLAGSGNTRVFTMPKADIVIYAEIEETPWYNVTVNVTGNGSVTASPTGGYEGEQELITLTVTASDGYHRLKGSLTSNYPGGINFTRASDNTYTFILPDADVTVYAVFEEISSADAKVIEFSGFINEDENIDLTLNNGNDLKWGDILIVTIEDNANYFDSAYKWYLDGSLRSETTNVIQIEIYSGYEIGIHQLLAIVYKDGIPYSKELIFRVKYHE
ncbi:MAG: hypothetical protein FWC03_03465 [Treponema sp.]|nr:hypothetical protein [Treponema sp.]